MYGIPTEIDISYMDPIGMAVVACTVSSYYCLKEMFGDRNFPHQCNHQMILINWFIFRVPCWVSRAKTNQNSHKRCRKFADFRLPLHRFCHPQLHGRFAMMQLRIPTKQPQNRGKNAELALPAAVWYHISLLECVCFFQFFGAGKFGDWIYLYEHVTKTLRLFAAYRESTTQFYRDYKKRL